jgi:hypothetical protein
VKLRRLWLCAAVALSLAAASTAQENAKPKPAEPVPVEKDPSRLYGFEVTKPLVDREKILPGGPGRDGIPALDAPSFAGIDAADAIAPETPVVGVAIGGDARAYLVPVLEYHQVVNDEVGGVAIAVTFDPLTGVARVFERNAAGRKLRFGVSGLLYNSGFLLYDRETQSLWSQFQGRAIAGPLAGTQLRSLRVRQEEFATWRKREAKTRILIPPDPERIDYNQTPYASYIEQDGSLFPIEARDRRFHAKELTLGVSAGGKQRAYLASLLTRNGGRAEDSFEGRKIAVSYESDRGVFEWQAPDDVEMTEGYWFAWKAFHPETSIWKDPGRVEGREP